ncbi:MAG: hypothetical protein F9K18_01095 [Thermoanaerobaculia bacterium]|nr:MAG: hypothetical protein F9K18_01095 [Thermoanaerobaculia bacterium]
MRKRGSVLLLVLSAAALTAQSIAAQTVRVYGQDLKFGMTSTEVTLACPNLYLDKGIQLEGRASRNLRTLRTAHEELARLSKESEGWPEERRRAYLEASGVFERLRDSRAVANLWFESDRLTSVELEVDRYEAADLLGQKLGDLQAIEFIGTFMGLVEQRLQHSQTSGPISTWRTTGPGQKRISLRLDLQPTYSIELELTEIPSFGSRWLTLSERFSAESRTLDPVAKPEGR